MRSKKLNALIIFVLSLVGVSVARAQSPSLDDIYKAAAADLVFGVEPAKRPFARYLSLHGIPEADRPDFLRALALAVNGAQFRGDLVKLEPVGPLLVRLDTEALGWDRFTREAELEKIAQLGVNLDFTAALKADPHARDRFVDVWEDIQRLDPFMPTSEVRGNGQISGGAFAAWTAGISHSGKFIASAHWFYYRILLERQDGGFYSQLLILPPTKADLERRFGLNRLFADVEPRGKHGAAVLASSGVAYNPREVQLLQPPTGYDQTYWWDTKDFIKANRRNKDVRQSPAGTANEDGGETLFSLPDGLMGAYLANGQDAGRKQVNIVPQEIAEDHRNPVIEPNGTVRYYSKTKSVVSPVKCYDCHGESNGLIGFTDAALRIIAPDRGDTGYLISSHDPKSVAREKQRIEEFYRKGLQAKLAMHRASYAARVRECTGLPVLEATRLLIRFYDRYTSVYASELVTPEQAAAEMSYPLPVARSLWLASGDDQLGYLAAGEPITRSQWELSVGKAFHVAAQPLHLKKAS